MMTYTHEGGVNYTTYTTYTYSPSPYYTGHIIPGFTSNEPSPIADKFIAILMVLCTALGTPANVTALLYFAFKQKTGSALLRTLYVTISFTDILICVSHLPVTVSLLCDREPRLFSNVS